jgi:hypothetical protein
MALANSQGFKDIIGTNPTDRLTWLACWGAIHQFMQEVMPEIKPAGLSMA